MLPLLAIAGAVCGIVGLVAGYLALRTLGRLRRTLALLHRDGTEDSFAQAVARQIAAVDALRIQAGAVDERIADLESLRTRIGELEDRAEQRPAPAAAPVTAGPAGGLHRVALVRYDAYPGMGGRMSWSVAMLDDVGNGLVLTAINARNEARTYARVMVDGACKQPLSDEEQRAVRQARGVDTPAPQRRAA